MIATTKLSAQVCRRAASLVREGWNRGYFAQDENEVECEPDSEQAETWCCAGARAKAISELLDQGLPDINEGALSICSREAVETVIHDYLVDSAPDAEVNEIAFNDEFAEDAEEVAQILLKAAERLEQ